MEKNNLDIGLLNKNDINIPYFKTASLDIDAQKGFTPLCPNELSVPDGHNIVDELNAQAQHAKFRIASKDWHPYNADWIATKEHPQLTKIENIETTDTRFHLWPQLPNMDVYWNAHCIAGTEGAELIDGLPDILDYDYIVYKGLERHIHPYGAAYHDINETISTGLIEFLLQNKVTHLILGGLALNYCVFKTALQLSAAGFIVIINMGACRAIGDPKEQLIEMSHNGVFLVDSFKSVEETTSDALSEFVFHLGCVIGGLMNQEVRRELMVRGATEFALKGWGHGLQDIVGYTYKENKEK